jgi:hypothetical protein
MNLADYIKVLLCIGVGCWFFLSTNKENDRLDSILKKHNLTIEDLHLPHCYSTHPEDGDCDWVRDIMLDKLDSLEKLPEH